MRVFHETAEPAKQLALTPSAASAPKSGRTRRDRGRRLERNERVGDSVVVALYRQRGSSHTESGQELPGLGIRLESRHRLSHPPEGQRAGLVSIHLDGNHAHPGLELDHGTLERLTQHPGRSQNGVPCERQLDEAA